MTYVWKCKRTYYVVAVAMNVNIPPHPTPTHPTPTSSNEHDYTYGFWPGGLNIQDITPNWPMTGSCWTVEYSQWSRAAGNLLVVEHPCGPLPRLSRCRLALIWCVFWDDEIWYCKGVVDEYNLERNLILVSWDKPYYYNLSISIQWEHVRPGTAPPSV